MKSLSLAAAAIMMVGALSAQSLTTTFASNNGQSGNMFDIVAINNVCITGFDVNVDPGTWNFEVYVRSTTGGYLPVVTTPSAWTLVGTATGVVSNGLNVPTPLPIAVDTVIAAGTTQAFYVTVTNGTAINYTNGAAGTTGTVFAQDANIQFLAGAGMSYPFGSNFNPRIFNGNIYYSVGGCAPGEYQTNSAESSLTLGGVTSNGRSAANTAACVGSSTALVSASSLAFPWDLGFTVNAPLVPRSGGALQTPNTLQVVNLNLLSPTFALLNNGSFAIPFVPLNLQVPAPPVGLELQAQLVVINPGNADGLSLSQAVNYSGLGSAASVAGPTGDDSSVAVNLSTPNCFGGSFSFMGTVFTQAQVISNGRVQFGTPDVDFSPTVAEALADAPFVGAWTDLNPAAGGSITITPAGSGFSVNYSGVANFGITGSANSFSFGFDNSSGAVTINLSAFNPVTAAGGMFLGLSAGTLGATDAGATAFTVGGAGAGAAASDMLYEFNGTGLAPAIGAGVTSITFLPLGGLGYAWTAL